MSYFYSQTTGGFYIKGCEMPGDCVEITDDIHNKLISEQSETKIISSDGNGYPVLIDKTIIKPSESDLAKKQIAEIEASITDRRLREAMLSTTGKSWMADRDAEIAALRAKII